MKSINSIKKKGKCLQWVLMYTNQLHLATNGLICISKISHLEMEGWKFYVLSSSVVVCSLGQKKKKVF